MKKRDVILDFTSLLDVTLIVIFFFVFFSHVGEEENKARIDDRIKEYAVAIQEAQEQKEETEALASELMEDMRLVSDANERMGKNVNGMLEFNRGQNLKLILDMEKDGWRIRIIHDEELVHYLEKQEDITRDLMSAMTNAGYDTEQTIFCDFVYDGSAGGTRAAYKAITEAMEEVKHVYKHIYISETDTSVGKE